MSLLSLQEQFKQNDINYAVKGNGPPVILVHGIAASLHDWTRLLPDLARAGYRLCPDTDRPYGRVLTVIAGLALGGRKYVRFALQCQ